MQNIIDNIKDVANVIFEFILSLLVDSPLSKLSIPAEMQDFMGYLNYYVPFQSMVNLAGLWVSGIAVYYMWQLVLRNIKAVK